MNNRLFYSLSIILYKRAWTYCIISMLFFKHTMYQVRSPPKCQSITTKLQFSTNNFSHPFDPWWFEWFGGISSINYIVSLLSLRFGCWVGGLHCRIQSPKSFERTPNRSLPWARPCPIDCNWSLVNINTKCIYINVDLCFKSFTCLNFNSDFSMCYDKLTPPLV